MTSTPAYGADRVVGADRPLRALSATPAIIVLLVGGLALRLTIAYVLFPGSGFGSDIGTYVSWASTMAHFGPGGFYANAGFADYPPAYLYVLWPVGWLIDNVRVPGVSMAAGDVIKLPPMLLDLAVGYTLYRLVKGWAWPGRRAETLALIAAAVYVFNPVTWYDSALWGQTDAAGALVLLLAVAALIRGNSEGAAGLAVLAALVKPQYGVVVIPLVAVLLLRRHVFHAGSGPRHAPWGPVRLRGWLAREQGFVRVVTSGVVALLVFHLLALPFGMDILGYLRLVGSAAYGYAYLTVNAFNLWALVGAGGNTSLAESLSWSNDTILLLGPLSGFAIGAALLAGGFLFGLFRAWRHDERRTIVLVTALLCLCFFFLPTRVHERYLLPVFAFLPILAASSRSWRVALVALVIGSFINLHAVLTIDQYGTDNVTSLPLGETFRSMPFILLSVVLQGGVLLFAVWRLRPAALAAPDGLDVAARQVAGWVNAGPVPQGIRDARHGVGTSAVPGAMAWPPTGQGGPGWPAPGPADAMPGAPPGWVAPVATELVSADHGRWVRGPGALAWLGSKVFVRPARRDRSASLVGERSGRLDRLDLLMVVVVAVSAFGLRAYRVAEPYGMYFDEVYHARTAMEFLQDWRYGITHSIYEYTHPHMAKYMMAWGIELFGDHRVTAQSDLATTVDDAAIEARWSPSDDAAEHDGDRLYVATGSSLEVYDLVDRSHVSTTGMDATAVAVDPAAHMLYIAGSDGTISSIDTTSFDAARRSPASAILGIPQAFATPTTAGRVTRLAVADDSLISLTDGGVLSSFDLTSGAQTGEHTIPGAVAVSRLPHPTDVVVVKPADVTDPKAVARILAEDLGLDQADIESRLRKGGDRVALSAWISAATKTAVQGHIDDGTLPGVSITGGTAAGVSGPDGLTILDAVSLDSIDSMDLEGPVQGMALGDAGLDDPSLYIAAGDSIKFVRFGNNGPVEDSTLPMPGPVTDVFWNQPSTLFHALGVSKDGTPTIYVIDPHGKSVFEDVALPFAPAATVVDTQPDRPSDDRTQILALAADGRMASVDIGGNAFGYRLPGVLMGALTAVCLYLLARLFFRRRGVAIFTAVLVLVEGMFFVNARIAMNDVYVTGFLTAALLLFTPLYLGLWQRRWMVALALVGVGVLLGLALASKWVAAYAIGGMVLLVLLRSALGRLIALLGMIALTALLGGLAIRPADVPNPHLNWLFLFLMLGLTMALGAAMVRRPVRFTLSELRFAVVASLVVGALFVVAGVVLGIQPAPVPAGQVAATATGLSSGAKLAALGVIGIATGIGAWMVAWLAGRTGRGPLATHTTIGRDGPAPSPAPTGWLLPGAWGGLPWLFALGCLVVVPVAVYIASYAPWIALGNQWYPGNPSDHGQTLWDLTLSMYDYHNNLRVGHPASSPWWAWPLDLKPVWFFQQSFANGTLGDIYDSGNLVIFWMSIPAMLFAAVAAWRRRSLPLTIVVLIFLAMWLPWVRIDRATFQYHYYSSLPFLVLALAYFLAELWHGPAHLAWVLARVGGALAILAPPLLWLSRQPLCVLAGTAAANAGGQACGPLDRQTSVSAQALVAAFVLLVGAGAAAWEIWYASRSDSLRVESGGVASSRRYSTGLVGALLVTAAVTLLGVLAAVALFSADSTVKLGVEAGQLAVLAVLLLAIPAWMVLRARDSRRFAIGIVGAAVLWFILWYPNLTGLPLPDSLANVYLGLLPTWNYDFQFTVNMDPPVKGSILDQSAQIIALATIVSVAGVMLVARLWSTGRGRSSAPPGAS